MTDYVTGAIQASVAHLRWLNNYAIKVHTHMSVSSPNMQGKRQTHVHIVKGYCLTVQVGKSTIKMTAEI